MFIENSEEFIEKLQGIIGKLCKIARYKIDKKKIIAFLYNSNKELEI